MFYNVFEEMKTLRWWDIEVFSEIPSVKGKVVGHRGFL